MFESVAHSLSHALVIMFLIGMAGSSVVVVITVIDDIREFFESDEPSATAGTGLK